MFYYPAVLALALAVAQAPPGHGDVAASDTIRIVDDLGRTLTLAAPAARIVSLIPARPSRVTVWTWRQEPKSSTPSGP